MTSLLANPEPLDLVIIVAPMAATGGRHGGWFYEDLLDRAGRTALAAEIELLEAEWPDTDVLVLRPDDRVLEVSRPNPMSVEAAIPSFLATLRSMRDELAHPRRGTYSSATSSTRFRSSQFVSTIATIPPMTNLDRPRPAVDTDPSTFNTRLESVASIVLAVAVVLTAWAAFEAAKWGGEQSIQFSVAGASRTESTRFDTRGGQLAQIDVAMFTDFVSAYIGEVRGRPHRTVRRLAFLPTPSTTSGSSTSASDRSFVRRWMRGSRPIRRTTRTPRRHRSLCPKYEIAEFDEAARWDSRDEAAADARTANQNGDNYVLTAVLFAAVLFFSGIASKLESRWNRLAVNLIGIIGVVIGAIILISLPILI